MGDLFAEAWMHVPETMRGPLAQILDAPEIARTGLVALLVVILIVSIHLAIPEGVQ